MNAAHPVRVGFAEMLARGPILFSGAVGTELERRGAPTPLPLWSAAAMEARPDMLRSIHAEYVQAGARIIVANTFRTDRWTLAKVGRSKDARTLTSTAIRLAREGVAMAQPDSPVLIVGSVAPIEDCYEPSLVPDEPTRRFEHAVRIGNLVRAGAAAAWIETMNTIREAVTALDAAAAGNLPAAVSFVCGPDGALLSGESLQDAARAVEPFEPLAISINCCHVDVATTAVRVLREHTDRPVGVWANGVGEPDEVHGWRMRGGTRDRAYVKAARGWLKAGAQIIGGCCGTTPRTIARLRTAIR